MVKRKREETESGQVDSAKRQRVQHKLKVGVTKIGHAFKVSKGFERQKLGRRRKTAAAKSNAQDVQRIDSEIAALKTLNTTASAQQHLFKILLKNKDVSSHPDLPQVVSEPQELPTDNASLNVHARLCKVNQVIEALNVAVLDVRKALGLSAESSKLSKKRRLRAKDYAADGTGQTADLEESLPHRSSAGNGSLHHEISSHSDDDEHFKTGTSTHVDGDSVSSPDDDTFEDDDIEALERRLAAEGHKSKLGEVDSDKYDIEADLSISEPDASEQSASPEPRKAQRSGKSSFVPSLTLAGYVEGSGSDIEDENVVAPRKNRRGQAARRQIAEKKYGSKANHLQDSNRTAKWDAKRGAVGGSGGYKARGSHSNSNSNYSGGRNGDEHQKKAIQKDDSGPLHPSWEAAKKAKQKDTPAAFKGNKITFD